MFPIRDLNPTRRLPVLTYVLLAVNILVFLWQQTLSPEQLFNFFMEQAAVPANITANPFSLETVLDVIRSMFLHGGWAHLIGNMLYLYLFGDNIEDRLGYILYLVLYFASGFVAVAAQVIIDPTSTIPMVGASGAIAGVLGSYLIMFPGVRVQGIIPIGRLSSLAEWPAWIVLGMWFVLQFFNGVASLSVPTEETAGGVAFFAHIGGFIAGLVLTLLFMRMVPQPPAEQRRELLYNRSRR